MTATLFNFPVDRTSAENQRRLRFQAHAEDFVQKRKSNWHDYEALDKLKNMCRVPSFQALLILDYAESIQSMCKMSKTTYVPENDKNLIFSLSDKSTIAYFYYPFSNVYAPNCGLRYLDVKNEFKEYTQEERLIQYVQYLITQGDTTFAYIKEEYYDNAGIKYAITIINLKEKKYKQYMLNNLQAYLSMAGIDHFLEYSYTEKYNAIKTNGRIRRTTEIEREKLPLSMGVLNHFSFEEIPNKEDLISNIYMQEYFNHKIKI